MQVILAIDEFLKNSLEKIGAFCWRLIKTNKKDISK